MAFLSHRCIRCHHPEYWAVEATRAGSAPRGFPVDGQPFQPSALARTWCGQCPGCKPTGCDYHPASYIVDQWNTDGTPTGVLHEPGVEVNGATAAAAKTYACPCDGCRRIWRAHHEATGATGEQYK